MNCERHQIMEWKDNEMAWMVLYCWDDIETVLQRYRNATRTLKNGLESVDNNHNGSGHCRASTRRERYESAHGPG